MMRNFVAHLHPSCCAPANEYGWALIWVDNPCDAVCIAPPETPHGGNSRLVVSIHPPSTHASSEQAAVEHKPRLATLLYASTEPQRGSPCIERCPNISVPWHPPKAHTRTEQMAVECKPRLPTLLHASTKQQRGSPCFEHGPHISCMDELLGCSL